MKQCVKDYSEVKNDKPCLNFDKSKSDTPDRIREGIIKNRFFLTGVVFLATFILGLLLSGSLMQILKAQAPLAIKFLYLAPDEAFIASIKVAVFLAAYLASPILLYQFIKPKLDNSRHARKKSTIKLIGIGFGLFTLGVLFAYYALIPLTLFFLLGFHSDLATTSFSMSRYIGFCLQIMLVAGIAFEFPVFLAMLSKINFASYVKLSSCWKQVAIGAFVISMVLTSTELFTQTLLTAFILFFYGFGIFITRLMEG